MPRPSKYPEEFRRDAVALVRSSPGRPLREIGREFGVNHETLRGWVNAAKRADESAARGRDDNELSPSDRDELRRLRKKVAELELEKDRQGSPVLCERDGSMIHRYRFISDHHATYGVARLCRVLAVKRRQSYYEWLAAQPARQERAEAEDALAVEIRTIHGEHRGSYGSPRVLGCALRGSHTEVIRSRSS